MNKIKQFFSNNIMLVNSILMSLIISLLVVSLYSQFVTKKSIQKIGTVDIQFIMKGITDKAWHAVESAPNQDISKLAGNIFKVNSIKLEAAIQQVATKHNVILVQKQAIVNYSNVPDYTKEVANEMQKIQANSK